MNKRNGDGPPSIFTCQWSPGVAQGVMDNLRKFTPPWTVQEDDNQCFRVYDATGFFNCSVMHREDLHERAFQYADNHLKREEARRIAKAISRLPDLLRRPPY